MKGNHFHAPRLAKGSFRNVLKDTQDGKCKWRLRRKVATCRQGRRDGTYPCIWVATTDEVRLLVETFPGRWDRYLVDTSDDDRAALIEAILLGGLATDAEETD